MDPSDNLGGVGLSGGGFVAGAGNRGAAGAGAGAQAGGGQPLPDGVKMGNIGTDLGASGAIASVYQPGVSGVDASDPATAPGGPFYDPYPSGKSGDGTKNDPWKADFQAPPDRVLSAVADAEIAGFDPTPDTPLTNADIYEGDGGRAGQRGHRGAAFGKERAEAFGRSGESEKHPVVEIAQSIEKKEVEPLEQGIEVVEKEHATLKEPVRQGVFGETLVSASGDDAQAVEVPISQGQYASGMKMNPGFSLRWLSELVAVMFRRGYRVIFRK